MNETIDEIVEKADVVEYDRVSFSASFLPFGLICAVGILEFIVKGDANWRFVCGAAVMGVACNFLWPRLVFLILEVFLSGWLAVAMWSDIQFFGYDVTPATVCAQFSRWFEIEILGKDLFNSDEKFNVIVFRTVAVAVSVYVIVAFAAFGFVGERLFCKKENDKDPEDD